MRQWLQDIDALLHESGLEAKFVCLALKQWRAAATREPTAKEQLNYQRRSRRALRCNLLRTLLQLDYRGFSCELAGHHLYQWFCLIGTLDQVQVPSKSELQRRPFAAHGAKPLGGGITSGTSFEIKWVKRQLYPTGGTIWPSPSPPIIMSTRERADRHPSDSSR